MNIWMLDYDPVVAARWHCDEHVKQSVFTNTQALAYAWHDRHNAMYSPMDEPPPQASDWLRYVVATVQSPDPGSKPLPPRRPMFPGESLGSWWELCGQRIANRRFDLPHASEVWAAELGGNYIWLWKLTMELTAEYHRRFGRRHPAAHCVWTLELMPPSLRDTAEEWAETKLDLPWAALKVVDGFYDSVESNRRYYKLMKEPTWTASEPPPWYKKELPTEEPA